MGVTLFNTAYINAITGTSLSNALNTPSLGLINFFPGGATLAQINALLPPFATANAPLPATTYYVLSTRQNNVLNLNIQGIDASVNYNYDAGDWGCVRRRREPLGLHDVQAAPERRSDSSTFWAPPATTTPSGRCRSRAEQTSAGTTRMSAPRCSPTISAVIATGPAIRSVPSP